MARASSACRTTNTTAHSGRRLAQGCSACSSTSSPRASVAPAASGYAYGSHRRSAQRWRRRKRYAHRHATPSFRSNISALSRACAAMYCLCAGPVARLKLLIKHPSVGGSCSLRVCIRESPALGTRSGGGAGGGGGRLGRRGARATRAAARRPVARRAANLPRLRRAALAQGERSSSSPPSPSPRQCRRCPCRRRPRSAVKPCL